MDISKIISKLQTSFGISRNELLFASLLLFGLIIGTFVQLFKADQSTLINPSKREIMRILDSIALVEKSTYTGADINGNKYPELAIGDTIAPKDSFYPESKKKDDSTSEKINLNTASIVELMKLPGVGKKTAQKIIDYRRLKPFRKSSDLTNVPSIGEKKFEKIKPRVVVK